MPATWTICHFSLFGLVEGCWSENLSSHSTDTPLSHPHWFSLIASISVTITVKRSGHVVVSNRSWEPFQLMRRKQWNTSQCHLFVFLINSDILLQVSAALGHDWRDTLVCAQGGLRGAPPPKKHCWTCSDQPWGIYPLKPLDCSWFSAFDLGIQTCLVGLAAQQSWQLSAHISSQGSQVHFLLYA